MKKEDADMSKFNFDDIFFGAYEIMNRKDELVVDPAIDAAPKTSSESACDESDVFRRFAHPSGSVGFYFARPEDHAGMTGACKTVEERDERCARGAGWMSSTRTSSCRAMPTCCPATRIPTPITGSKIPAERKGSESACSQSLFVFVPLAFEDQSSKSWGAEPHSSSIFSP